MLARGTKFQVWSLDADGHWATRGEPTAEGQASRETRRIKCDECVRATYLPVGQRPQASPTETNTTASH